MKKQVSYFLQHGKMLICSINAFIFTISLKMIRTSNPALNNAVFQTSTVETDKRMTVSGTLNKSLFLICMVFCSAILSWDFIIDAEDGRLYVFFALACAIVLGVVTYFKPPLSPMTVPAYALFKGVFLGGISGWLNEEYPGIAIHAVLLTSGTFICLLSAYKCGLFSVTENFKLGIVAATGSICLIYLITFSLTYFNIQVPLIHGNGLIGIVFSLVVVGVAALNLVLDFDFIEQGEIRGAPEYMEWYASYGLLVTLIWLYFEIVRMLINLGWRKK